MQIIYKYTDLSTFSVKALHKKKYCPVTKLVPKLKDKKNYITYHKNLKFYLQQGLKLLAVHKVLKFKQKLWLKKYIDFNTKTTKQNPKIFLQINEQCSKSQVIGQHLLTQRCTASK